MDAFRAWLGQLQFDGVWQTVVLVAASLLCITFHETCHGWVAYKLGDPTAKRMGRLTLNPLKHVDLGQNRFRSTCGTSKTPSGAWRSRRSRVRYRMCCWRMSRW